MKIYSPNFNIHLINYFQIFQQISSSLTTTTIFIVLVTLMTDDLWNVSLIVGLRGCGVMIGSMLQMPFIDKIPFKITVRVFNIAHIFSTLFCIYSLQNESSLLLNISQFTNGITISVFPPIVGTIIAISTNPIERADINSNQIALGQAAQAIGPLIGAIAFKIINDDWDKDLCRQIVFIGYGCSIISTIILLFTSRKYQVDEQVINLLKVESKNEVNKQLINDDINRLDNSGKSVSDDQKIIKLKDSNNLIEEFSQNEKLDKNYQVKFLNLVLILILVNKVVKTLTLMNTKLLAQYWKDKIAISPFNYQLVTFISIILASFLSSKVTPMLYNRIGESATGFQIDLAALIFQVGFLGSQQLKDHLINLASWQMVLSAQFIMQSSVKISNLALWKTIIMDQTAPEHQGKWNIIDSAFLVCCSPAGILGGFLCTYIGLFGLNWLCAFFNIVLCVADFQIYVQSKDQQQEKVDARKQIKI